MVVFPAVQELPAATLIPPCRSEGGLSGGEAMRCGCGVRGVPAREFGECRRRQDRDPDCGAGGMLQAPARADVWMCVCMYVCMYVFFTYYIRSFRARVWIALCDRRVEGGKGRRRPWLACTHVRVQITYMLRFPRCFLLWFWPRTNRVVSRVSFFLSSWKSRRNRVPRTRCPSLPQPSEGEPPGRLGYRACAPDRDRCASRQCVEL